MPRTPCRPISARELTKPSRTRTACRNGLLSSTAALSMATWRPLSRPTSARASPTLPWSSRRAWWSGRSRPSGVPLGRRFETIFSSACGRAVWRSRCSWTALCRRCKQNPRGVRAVVVGRL